MIGRKWIVAMFVVVAGPVLAEQPAEWQLSLWGGEQHFRMNHDLHFRDENIRLDTFLNGIAMARRTPSGFLVEGSYETGFHEATEGKDTDFDIDHWSAGLGWQIDVDRMRITPKVGVSRTRVHNDARLLLNESGDRVFHRYFTAPYAELAIQRRLGRHWQLGGVFRNTFEDFGYTRSWSFGMTVVW